MQGHLNRLGKLTDAPQPSVRFDYLYYHTGAVALVGHNFPAHLKFKGGRGAATAVGVLIASLPIIGLPIGMAGLVLLYFTRKAIYPLAMFLIAIPVLAYPVGYSPAWAVYAVVIPISVGLSHLFTTRILKPGAEKI